MDSAREIFERLKGFKEPDTSEQSSAQRLQEYCANVLGAVEPLHIEFKQKRNPISEELDDDDRKNLAKAVSGFANSGGGVLIWGIEDKTMSPKPIANIQRFVKALLELAPQTTDPIAQGLDGDWIPSGGRHNKDKKGFGLILIPESLLPPHRVTLNFKEQKKSLLYT